MWDAGVWDKENNILSIKWSGRVTPDEVAAANEKLQQILQDLAPKSFDVVVEMENLMAFSPETQEAIVEHQRWLLEEGMRYAAVVVDKATAKMQLKRTAKESGHSNEFHFDTIDEAIEFLKNK
ncbi:SpoIIAA-like protein [Salsuginibacillus halophilus]|uniref:SpoIIAA-like protein n=1 Tax=Salsuginibacillus halophilus TaxID=517424 RepID=A0A2P8H3P5_9BACI|nr:STAS/SEC14 domain-containing protein [Salsuginibacillus halophilus]PSL40838.1 SpoIIAA-like protein [Salsuginibacillus halophilus]